MNLHSAIMREVKNLKRSEWRLVELLSEFAAESRYIDHRCGSLLEYSTCILQLNSQFAKDVSVVASHAAEIPALVEALRDGRTTLSKLRRVCAVITVNNQKEWLELACECTSRVIERCVALAKVGPPAPSKRISFGERVERAVREVAEFESARLVKPISMDEALFAMARAYSEKYDLPFLKSGTCHLNVYSASETKLFENKADKLD